jgi:hypothetical protein
MEAHRLPQQALLVLRKQPLVQGRFAQAAALAAAS